MVSMTVREALQKDEPGEPPILSWLQQERDDGGTPIDEQEDGVEREHLFQVGQRVRGAMLLADEPHAHETPHREQVRQG